MTRWQKIVHKIELRLGEIQVASGFRTDAGLNRILIDTESDPERAFGGQEFDAGLVIQMDPAEPADEQGEIRPGGAMMVMYTRQLSVFGYRRTVDRENWFDRAQELEADIKQTVFSHPEDQQFYKQIGLRSIRIGTAESTIPGYGDEYLGTQVALEITYVENLSDPWEPA